MRMIKIFWTFLFLLLWGCASADPAVETSEQNQLPPLPFQDDFDERKPWLRDTTVYVEINVKDSNGDPIPYALVLGDIRPLHIKESYPSIESGSLAKVMRMNPGAWNYVSQSSVKPLPYTRYVGRANDNGRLVDKLKKGYWERTHNARPETFWVDYVVHAPGYEVVDKTAELTWEAHNVVVDIVMQPITSIDQNHKEFLVRLSKLKYIADSVLEGLGIDWAYPDRKLLQEQRDIHTASVTVQNIDSFKEQYEYIDIYHRYLLEQLDELSREARGAGVNGVYCIASLWKSYVPNVHKSRKVGDANTLRLEIVQGADSSILLDEFRHLAKECPEEPFPQILLAQFDLMQSDRRSLSQNEMKEWLESVERIENSFGEVNWPVVRFWMQDFYLRVKKYDKAKEHYKWILENAPNLYTRSRLAAVEYELKSFKEHEK